MLREPEGGWQDGVTSAFLEEVLLLWGLQWLPENDSSFTTCLPPPQSLMRRLPSSSPLGPLDSAP